MSHLGGQPRVLISNEASHSSLHFAQDESLASSFMSSPSGIPGRQPIALVLAHGDPATELGSQEARSQNVYVRQVGEALAKLGWQVDMFTRKTNPDDEPIVQHSPYCRTIRLVVGSQTLIPRDDLFEYLPTFVEAFLKFQSKEGTNYPLVHTNYWLSAWVGLQLKQSSNIQLVHTYHSLGTVKAKAVSVRSPMLQTRLAVEQQTFEQANCIVATSPQEQEMLQSAFPSHKARSALSVHQARSLFSHQSFIQLAPCSTDSDNSRKIPKLEAGVALQLSQTYRRLLAQSIMDERLWHLPLPNPGETEVSQVKRPSVTPVESLTLAS